MALFAIETPRNLVSRVGDGSIVLHWDGVADTNLSGYRVYRAASLSGPFGVQNLALLTSPSYCDARATNGVTWYYRVTAVAQPGQESEPSAAIQAAARPFVSDEDFLEYVQQTAFDYFWYESNPVNGMVRDRSTPASPCSIAAVGFGLTAIGIGIDHGWITRAQGRARVLQTVRSFWTLPQGDQTSGTAGHNGWFYHFLDMRTGLRYTPFQTELSSIDTALLLAGILYAGEYFDGPHPDEVEIRQLAEAIANRIDWNWMAQGTNVLSMGWMPGSGFLASKWIGYNEASILYILGLGAEINPLPASSWDRWTAGYRWATNYGQAYVPFAPLFGHQYSQCWLDLRHTADNYMRGKSITYFENSRRATIAQRAYCAANPKGYGYSTNVWGLTACDGPGGYSARGAPPPENDDGTIAPTAPGGSMPFAPEYCLPALRTMYDRYRAQIWTGYGFRDAFNLRQNWWASDVLGIDEGPIVVMIENHRSQSVWRLFMKNKQVQRGLKRAGFAPLPSVAPRVRAVPEQGSVTLEWDSVLSGTYQVEYSANLAHWFPSPTGHVLADNAPVARWLDTGPPATLSSPFYVAARFYRVYQLGPP